jgi:hypothetical protein
MTYLSVKDSSILAAAERLINLEGEVLLLFRYRAAAGSREFMFTNEMKLLETKLKELPAHTHVVLYGGGQLPSAVKSMTPSFNGYWDQFRTVQRECTVASFADPNVP